MKEPKIAVTNEIEDIPDLLSFIRRYQFAAIDWSFREIEDLPFESSKEQWFVNWIKAQNGTAIRYHCAIPEMELAHANHDLAQQALENYKRLIQIISQVGGRFITIHIGLGQPSSHLLSWKTAIENLSRLVEFGRKYAVTVCLENLLAGWTSRPDRLKELIGQSGAGVTLDIGHVYSCEAIQTGKFTYSDFIDSSKDRVFNAHIYHYEELGLGHLPPRTLDDVLPRLKLLMDIRCDWWVIELTDAGETLHTNLLLQDFLTTR